MRRLIVIVAVLATLYASYWAVGARTVARGTDAALAVIAQSGWSLEIGSQRLRGFPSRFDTTLTDVAVTDPAGIATYRAPFLQVFALSYRPNRVIAVWPDTQTLALPGVTLTLASSTMRASGGVAAQPDLPFRDATLEIDAGAVTSDAGPGGRFARALLALRQSPGMPLDYDLYATLEQIVLNPALQALATPEGMPPALIERVALDAVVTLAAPLDRNTQGIAPTGLQLNALSLEWGAIQVTGNGTLRVDDAGRPTGRITLSVTGWRDLIGVMSRIGVVDPGVAPTWENVVGTLAQGSETVDLPFNFRGGLVFLGPLPLGPAPVLAAE